MPNKGIQDLQKVVDTVFPELELKDEVYAQGILEFALEVLKLDKTILDDPTQFQLYIDSLSKLVQDSSSPSSDQQKALDLAQSIVLNQSQGADGYS